MVGLPGQVEVDADAEPGSDLAADVRTDRVAFHIGIRLDTLPVEGAQRDVIVTALAAARYAQVGLPGRGVLPEDPFAPVRLDVVLQAEVLQFLELGVLFEAGVGQFAEGEPLLGVHQFHRELRQVRDTVGSADRHGRFLAGTFLGGDVHHAVGGTGTVDGGGGSVLHHRHVLDVVGVQGRENGHIDRRAVEDEQRRIRSIDRVDAAQAHRNRCARLTGTGIDLQTGHLALQGVAGTGRRNFRKRVGFDERRGTDNRTDLLGGAIRHDDGLLQDIHIGSQHGIDDASAADQHLQVFITDGGEDQGGAGRHALQDVIAVGIRRGSRHRPFHRDAGEGNGTPVLRSGHLAGNPVLRRQRQTRQRHQRKDEYFLHTDID